MSTAKNNLPFPRNSSLPLNRRSSTVVSSNSHRIMQPLNTNPSSRNPKINQLFHPLHDIFNFIFKGFASFLFPPPALAMENYNNNNSKGSSPDWDPHGFEPNMTVQLDKLSGLKKYKVASINFLNPRTRAPMHDASHAFNELHGLRPGQVYTKNDLAKTLDHLSSTSYFEHVGLDTKTNADGTVDVNIPFQETTFPSKSIVRCLSVGSLPEEKPVEFEFDPKMTEKESIAFMKAMIKRYQKRIDNARECILPRQVQERMEWELRQQPRVRARLVARMVNRIQKWYLDNGYYGARVVGLGPMDQGGEIHFEVNEGDIVKLGFKFEDKLLNEVEGHTNIEVVKRVLPEEVAVGKVYNDRAFQRALQNIQSLNLFSSLRVIQTQDKRTGAFSIDIALQEQPLKWHEVKTDWNISPGRGPLPTIDWLHPGKTITFGHRNIKGLNRSLQGSITLSNLFDPGEDVEFDLEYTHPHLDGIDNPRNCTFQANCFNTRKRSPVFWGVPGADTDEMSIWVDRKGIKATVTEEYTKQSKFTYGLVMKDVKTRDELGTVVARGQRGSYNGQAVRGNGPVTTLSGTGHDRLAFLQANLTRDNTRFVNGAIVGERDVFQVDQGLGVGTNSAFFNRATISATRFIPLRKVDESKGKAAPPTLVLNGVYGMCVGDLPNHEAFAIGGPHSVRGYDIGEIGASRKKLEVAAEVRVPVFENGFVYAFAEHGNDMGGSVGLSGNPTKSYMRKGYGSSYGVGIKYSQFRAEYAVDHNTSKGGLFFHFGDRF